jgi:DNA modification methylase
MAQHPIIQANATALPFGDQSVDLVFASPPYQNARTYGIGADLNRDDWVDLVFRATAESLRVCKGPVCWVVSDVGSRGTAIDRLRICVEDDLGAHAVRPCIWTANKPPTSAGTWYANAWEYVLAFSRVWPAPYFDVSEIATPLKYPSRGHFRQRSKDGTRKRGGDYPKHPMRKTMPNHVHVTVGGGQLGSPLSHLNEAPFPEKLVEYFVRSLCPPGGVVLDPFSGSGTTAAVAVRYGRRFVASDLRESQCELTRRRLAGQNQQLAGFA